MKISFLSFCLLFALIIFSSVVKAQTDGSFDSTFNNTGIVEDTSCGVFNEFPDIALEPDGKIVVSSWKNYVFSVTRYMPDGSRDNSFDGDGLQVIPNTEFSFALALQQDGKIVVGGEILIANLWDFVLTRLKADGSLDSTFGALGVATTDLFQHDDACYDIAIQPDGKIVAVGETASSTKNYCAVVRYTAFGIPDTTFGSGGIDSFNVNHTGAFQQGKGVVILNDNKIVVAGTSSSGTTAPDSIFILRLNTNGTLDNSFGNNGVSKFGVAVNEWSCTGMRMQSDGKFIAYGVQGGAPQDMLAVRFNADGSVDNSYNGSGFNAVNLGSDAIAYGGAVQPDGKMVLVGQYVDGFNNGYFALCRLNVDGTQDMTFGQSGKVLIQLTSTYYERLHNAVVQPDGKIVAAGILAASGNETAIMRFHGSDLTGIEESISSEKKIMLYPNPAKDKVTFSLPSGNQKLISVELMDLNGRKIKSPGCNQSGNNCLVKLPDVPSGMYLLKVISSGQSFVTDVMIEE